MLKRLELIGFKSFADRTRFDFAPGITAVVGPNGSGKSNIVDAVRWLLGEQSAKSLRGGEMTDVIFNGSSTRKSLGLAEVTMTFDNSAKLLSIDADEVQVTRRVYRDGQGEYLINGQDARLKDIKELFLGSGAGHGAYSVIEQGRVDALLAASTKDRRLIFEEAAGVSRFKAKKIETLRKLDRVDGDLVRVRDILAELEKQLRTLRLQAAKAQRYRDHTDRLTALRVGVAIGEYRSLGVARAAEEAVLVSLREELATATARTKAGDDELRKLDRELTRTDDALRHQESRLADARQQIATHETAARADRAAVAGLDAELLRLGKQRLDLGIRTQTVETEAARVASEIDHIARHADAEQHRADATAAALQEVTARIADLTARLTTDRETQYALVVRSTRLHADAEQSRAQADRLRHEIARKKHDADQATHRRTALERMLADLSTNDADIRQKLETARQTLTDHLAARDGFRHRADVRQTDLDALRNERSALRGRLDVLEGFERTLEGLGAGVRAVLHRVRAGEPPLAGAVVGLVADLLTVPRKYAPYVDLVLGDAAQRFVVFESSLDAVLQAVADGPGRVGFVALAPLTGGTSSPEPGVLAAIVRCEHPDFAHLPNHLLGHVRLVEDLSTARRLAATHPGDRFITRAGEVLDADGAITVGPAHAEAGILSRKSELRDLHHRMTDLDSRIADGEAEQAALRRRAEELDGPIRQREAEIATRAGEAGTLRDRILEQRQIHRQLGDTIDLVGREVALLEGEHAKAEAARHDYATQAAAVDDEGRALKARLEATDAALSAAERDRERRVHDNTAAQVNLSRVTDQLAALRRKKTELEAELRQRRIDAVNLGSAERSARGKHTESTLAVLRATAAAATAYGEKDNREYQTAELAARRDSFRTSKDALHHELKASREVWSARHGKAHAHELAARDLANRQEATAQRIREDYGIELSDQLHDEEIIDLVVEPAGEAASGLAGVPPAQEIDELRQKIARLGSVNLEALDELADVEKREGELRSQFDDLAESRGKLQQIIDQINADSRRLFSETLATVRGHFQELFRKLFAGGSADVVLEDETDVLESGIEITARPPGKEPQRISLLSGGERALTAVALLLAIFRSKPSPFCLLDEVDAAMDEANTQRLAGLLREFSDRSQFIVITHKKRTMAVADVLHGITMQESGISKLVAVRFEDWPEEEAKAEAA